MTADSRPLTATQPAETASPVPAPTLDGQGDAESRDDEALEAAAKAIYATWWEDNEPDVSAQWENLAADDDDRLVPLASARAALAAAVPHLERQIRDDERAKVLTEAFEAISARLGMAGDQTARMIALAALRSVSS